MYDFLIKIIIMNNMFDYQYGDNELKNIINHPFDYPEDKLPHITLEELINNIKNNAQIEAGTFVHISLHDLTKESVSWNCETYVHIPTNTKVTVEYDEQLDGFSRTTITIPGINGTFWIGDDIDDNWYNMTTPNVNINAFELKSFQEYD